MLAKGAADRHKAVAYKPVPPAARLPSCGGGNGEALNALWQGDGLPRIANMLKPVPLLPIGIKEIAVAQIGDARAANPREKEGYGVPAYSPRAAQCCIFADSGFFGAAWL